MPRGPQTNKKSYSEDFAERYLRRLRGVEGNNTLAAESLGVDPSTIRVWQKRHPEFREQVQRVLAEIGE